MVIALHLDFHTVTDVSLPRARGWFGLCSQVGRVPGFPEEQCHTVEWTRSLELKWPGLNPALLLTSSATLDR